MRRQACANDRVVMAGLDDALARIANDPAWADAVRTQPQEALRGYDPVSYTHLDVYKRQPSATRWELCATETSAQASLNATAQ